MSRKSQFLIATSVSRIIWGTEHRWEWSAPKPKLTNEIQFKDQQQKRPGTYFYTDSKDNKAIIICFLIKEHIHLTIQILQRCIIFHQHITLCQVEKFHKLIRRNVHFSHVGFS